MMAGVLPCRLAHGWARFAAASSRRHRPRRRAQSQQRNNRFCLYCRKKQGASQRGSQPSGSLTERRFFSTLLWLALRAKGRKNKLKIADARSSLSQLAVCEFMPLPLQFSVFARELLAPFLAYFHPRASTATTSY